MIAKRLVSLAGGLSKREYMPEILAKDGLTLPSAGLVNTRVRGGNLEFDQGYEEIRYNVGLPTCQVSVEAYSPEVHTEIPNTVLLVQVDEAGNIVEQTGNGELSFVGSVFVDDTITHDGFGSIRNTVPGSVYNNLSYTVITSDYYELQDFTVEFWLYPLTVEVYTSNTYVKLCDGELRFGSFSVAGGVNRIKCVYLNNPVITLGYDFSPDTWVHVAIVRSGSSLKLYLDGILVGSVTCDTDPIFTNPDILGADGDTCCIENFRVSNIALYTENFTPPGRF